MNVLVTTSVRSGGERIDLGGQTCGGRPHMADAVSSSSSPMAPRIGHVRTVQVLYALRHSG